MDMKGPLMMTQPRKYQHNPQSAPRLLAIIISGAIAAFLTLLRPSPTCAAPATRTEVLNLLNTPFQKTLFHNTYESLLHRVDRDGYLQESLTGAYGGMFPRTVGPYVFLMLETHQWAVARRVLRYTLEATAQAHLHRVPHVIGPAHISICPEIDAENPGQILHSIVLYNLRVPTFGGAQPFKAIRSRLYGADMWLSGSGQGELRVAVVRTPTDIHPIAQVVIPAGRLLPAGGWVRVRFQKPVVLQKGATYNLRLQFHGRGNALWWGLNNVVKNPFRGCYSHDKPPLGWRFHPNYVTAFALNYGTLKYRRREVIPLLSNTDEVDGQYSVILAWARYINTTHDIAFENATYHQVARLADQATITPYLDNAWPTTTTDLVRNPSFEHSRQDRFWDTYDLLTQVFTAEAWRELIPIAEARGDLKHVDRWQTALHELQHGIRYYLTRRLGGKLIYAEMRLPDGRDGKIYTGLSWVNLSPIAAGWKGVNPKILGNTVAAYWKRAAFKWHGFNILACQWNPPSKIEHVPVRKKFGWIWVNRHVSRPARISRSLIGKQWAWAFLYAVQQHQWGRACHMLEFLKQAYKSPIIGAPFPKNYAWPVFAECFWFQPDGKIVFSDPGNGEQCSWYCWAITTARRLLAQGQRH